MRDTDVNLLPEKIGLFIDRTKRIINIRDKSNLDIETSLPSALSNETKVSLVNEVSILFE